MPGTRIPTTVLLLLLAPLTWHCAAPREDPPERPAAPAAAAPTAETIIAGRSVLGADIRCRVLGSGPDTVLILATIHGNEGLGSILVEQVARHLLHDPELLAGRRVLLVPVANPDGLRRGTRGNARQVDLNRNFPASNFRPGRGGPRALSEPEAKAVHHLIVKYRPQRVVSIHQPLALVDFDGPGAELAQTMSRSCRLQTRRLGGRPGSLGSWVGGDLGIPIITLELPRIGGLIDEDALWRRYGAALLAAVRFRPTEA